MSGCVPGNFIYKNRSGLDLTCRPYFADLCSTVNLALARNPFLTTPSQDGVRLELVGDLGGKSEAASIKLWRALVGGVGERVQFILLSVQLFSLWPGNLSSYDPAHSETLCCESTNNRHFPWNQTQSFQVSLKMETCSSAPSLGRVFLLPL